MLRQQAHTKRIGQKWEPDHLHRAPGQCHYSSNVFIWHCHNQHRLHVTGWTGSIAHHGG